MQPRVPSAFSRIIRLVDHFDYLERESARRDANRTLLGLVSFMFFIAGLGCFAGASQKIETKSSGHFWWKDETTAVIPTETRLAWLLAAVLLMLVAFALALITYRVSRGRGAAEVEDSLPRASSVMGRSPQVTSGHSKEFWIQTTIAIVGLVITAGSAAAAWWA